MFYYAGIGSRETPNSILVAFEQLGRELIPLGGILRSGRADGADAAFERGCIAGNGPSEIFIPWAGFPKNSNLVNRPAYIFDRLEYAQQQQALASIDVYHPAPDRLSPGSRKLMARNYCQIHGPSVSSPLTNLVICYTRDGQPSGGTGQALRMAADAGIAIINAHGCETRPDAFVQGVLNYVRQHF